MVSASPTASRIASSSSSEESRPCWTNIFTWPPAAAISSADATYTPAFGIDDFFIDLVAIAEAGQVDEQGVPHLLPLMVLLDDYPDACYLSAPSVAPPKETIRTLACSGRVHGFGRAHAGRRVAA